MKAARLAILGLALGAGFLAFNMMATQKPQVIEVREETPAVETVDVLVAAADITLGTTLADKDLRWQPFPKDAVGAGFVTRDSLPEAMTEMTGSVARMPLLQGEPINMRKIVRIGEGGVLAAILTPGTRAVATEISALNGAGGFILPNDRVDVLLTRAGETTGQAFVTETILKNVRVLAIDQLIEEQDGQKVVVGDTATLELLPSQSEILAHANRVGDVSLVLRPLADNNTQDTVEQKQEDNRLTLMRYGVSRQTSGVQ